MEEAKEEVQDVLIKQDQFVIRQEGNFTDYYQLGEVLGSGTFGEVRACKHIATGLDRAVKIIKNYNNEKQVKGFYEEIDILCKLNHPNIIKMYEIYSDEKKYYLVTDLYTGGELFDKIVSIKHFSEEGAASIMRQLLSAITYCHNNKIVHRDIKPENLILESGSPDAAIKLIDFGYSQVFKSDEHMKLQYGTCYYIAPEILEGDYTEKCDVWSCGVIMFLLLCGQPPFYGHDSKSIVQAVIKGVYRMSGPLWDSVSDEAKDLVIKLLTRDKDQRITANDAFKHEWIQNTAPKPIVDKATTNELLKHLEMFKSEQKLQQAALTYIVSNLMSLEEKKEMRKVFQMIDTSGDGRLSRDELIVGFKKLHGEHYPINEEVDRIMENVDIDHNGYIDYSEFQLATLGTKHTMSKKKLQCAFSLFDKDGEGAINADKIKAVLGVGQKFNDEVWNEIIREVDYKKDGKVSFEEFQMMMHRFVDPSFSL